jgi:hypothetical protein
MCPAVFVPNTSGILLEFSNLRRAYFKNISSFDVSDRVIYIVLPHLKNIIDLQPYTYTNIFYKSYGYGKTTLHYEYNYKTLFLLTSFAIFCKKCIPYIIKKVYNK